MDELQKETKIRGKRHLGMIVVGIVLLVLLGLGYYYTAGPDTTGNVVLVAVRGYLSVEQKDALTSQFLGYAPDDADGGINLKVYEFPAAHGQPGETSKLFGELQNEIKNGTADLILLDRYVYDMLGDERLFEDLSALYPGDPALSGNFLYGVNGKPFAKASGLEELPELYLALRSGKLNIVNKNAQNLEKHAYQLEILNNIAFSTPPSGYVAQGLD
ncbi:MULTISPECIES: hypothetical protein [Anaerotruncus]|uniref:hypothetical protein n=1 Tax=Anaerotruncus TaxID=244127 RepID=UPI0008354885|nr:MULTISPECIES: hypothetical protein [Anaerotruncus]RGX54229.1 hypothetical protein DWV16_15020 [Anaerotruncus sp. AF02-27]